MLHQVGDPVINGARLSSSTRKCGRSWHASVIASGAPDSVFVVTTAADGGLVRTSSISGTGSGHPGHLALGMLSGAVLRFIGSSDIWDAFGNIRTPL